MKDEYKSAFPGIYVLGHVVKGDWEITKNLKIKAKKRAAPKGASKKESK